MNKKLFFRLVDVIKNADTYQPTMNVVMSDTGSITVYSCAFSRLTMKSLTKVLNDFDCIWSIFPLEVEGKNMVSISVAPF